MKYNAYTTPEEAHNELIDVSVHIKSCAILLDSLNKRLKLRDEPSCRDFGLMDLNGALASYKNVSGEAWKKTRCAGHEISATFFFGHRQISNKLSRVVKFHCAPKKTCNPNESFCA